MTEQQIVEYLKTNIEAYCLMPKEAQAYLEGKPFIMLSADGSFWSSWPAFNSAEWTSTGTFRLRADYQPAKWWFLAPSASRDVFLAMGRVEPNKEWQEISPEFAAYLRAKPEGECELRKVKTGDNYLTTTSGLWIKSAVGRPRGDFRWCRPEAELATVEELARDNVDLREKYAESEARCLRLEVITRERDELKQALERQEGEITRLFIRAFAAEAELDALKRQLSELLKRMAL